jgi:hypothetical protein
MGSVYAASLSQHTVDSRMFKFRYIVLLYHLSVILNNTVVYNQSLLSVLFLFMFLFSVFVLFQTIHIILMVLLCLNNIYHVRACHRAIFLSRCAFCLCVAVTFIEMVPAKLCYELCYIFIFSCFRTHMDIQG